MNALLHLASHEEILRALHKLPASSLKPAGISFALGLEMLKKDPKFVMRHMFGRNAKYGPMTPEGVGSNSKLFQRRFFNLVGRYGKVKLRRNKALRKLVKSKGKNPRDIGKTFTLVPKRTWIKRKLEGTYGSK